MKRYVLNRGVLIAIEGIDGAGKTTMVTRLKDYFSRKQFQVSNFKEPTDGQYGQEIKRLAREGRENITPEEEMKLFLEDRKENREKNIEPALERKEIVIMDRYYFSSVAYQGARGLDKNYIYKENEKVARRPDIVIILDCAVTIGLKRIEFQRGDKPNHFEKEELLEKARRIFKAMEKPYIQEIDSSRPEDEVFENIKNIVSGILVPFTQEITDQPDLFTVESHDNQSKFYKN